MKAEPWRTLDSAEVGDHLSRWSRPFGLHVCSVGAENSVTPCDLGILAAEPARPGLHGRTGTASVSWPGRRSTAT